MPIADCPNCEEPVHVDSPEVGIAVNCSDCGADLEIVGVDPLELEEDESGYDDDEDDEDVW